MDSSNNLSQHIMEMNSPPAEPLEEKAALASTQITALHVVPLCRIHTPRLRDNNCVQFSADTFMLICYAAKKA